MIRRCVRWLARTAKDANGFYPAPGANVYPIVFLAGSFTESAGTQTLSATERSAHARAVVMNLAASDWYLPEGTNLRVWRIGHRYYAHRCSSYGCIYEEDQWDREDDDDPGTIWTETAGDWDVLDETLVTSDADAKCTCATLAPASSMKYIVGVAVQFDADGDVARVYLNDSAQFAEIERITSTWGRLRIYDGTTCKGSVEIALAEWTQLVLCSKGDRIDVGVGGAPLLTLDITVESSIIALGTGACTGTIAFDALTLQKHHDDLAICPTCGPEGCTWFRGWGGAAAGALSAADFTTTGTWAYVPGAIRCTANGALTIAPTHPKPSGKTTAAWFITNWGYEVKAVFSLGGSATLEILNVYLGSVFGVEVWGWQCKVMSGGVQYGITIEGNSYPYYSPNYFRLCWDGTIFSASVRHEDSPYDPWRLVGAVADAVAVLTPKVDVSLLDYGEVFDVSRLEVWKHQDDMPACGPCCGTLTIANLQSPYGCTCPPVSIPIVQTGVGWCAWAGNAVGPCASGTWWASISVSAVTGGYKLSATIVEGFASATFETTLITETPPNCALDFVGNIPLASTFGSGVCGLASATCELSFP